MRRDERDSDEQVDVDDAAQRRRNERQQSHLDEHAAGDDPRVPRLASRQVVADEDVREREQSDRQCVRRQHRAAFGEVRSERGRDETDAGGRIEERERSAERRRGEQRPAEDVLRLLASRLARSGSREQNGEDRRREEEADAGKRRRGSVRAGIVAGQTRLHDEDVDVGQEGDSDDADEDRPEIAQERAERRSCAFPVLQRLTDQREREEGACNRRHDRREDRSAEPVARCRGNGEQAEPQHERGDVHRRDRMKALAALQDSHRYGKDERRRRMPCPRAAPSRWSGC